MAPIDLIDSARDSAFATLQDLRWRPWIGRRFQALKSPRLLLIGESHYAQAQGMDSLEVVLRKNESDPNYTRTIVWECPVSGCWKNPTLDNIPRLLLGTTRYDSKAFWQDVAFYNLVQRMMRYVDPPERPSHDDFTIGWAVFHQVIGIVKPDLCVFLGSQARHTFAFSMGRLSAHFTAPKRSSKVGRCWSYRASFSVDDREIPIIFIQHPGKFFSHSRWHTCLRKEFPSEIETFRNIYNV